MSYLRNPRMPFIWESDGDAPFGKYKAADGTLHDSGNKADDYDLEREQWPWKEIIDAKEGTSR